MNFNSDVKLYVIIDRPFTIIDSEILIPITTNEDFGSKMGITTTDNGFNIQYLSDKIGELTAFYWAWKNDYTSRLIGFNLYYRYLFINKYKESYNPNIDLPESCGWDRDFIVDDFSNYDLIVPYPLQFETTLYQQYCKTHEKFIIDKFMEIINTKYPSCSTSFYNALNRKYGYFESLFIMRREDFDEYMEFLFDVVDEILPTLNNSTQEKPFFYLAEIIFSCYVEYVKDAKNLKIKEVNTLSINS